MEKKQANDGNADDEQCWGQEAWRPVYVSVCVRAFNGNEACGPGETVRQRAAAGALTSL